MVKEIKGKDGNIVWRIDKSKKVYEYCFQQGCAQEKVFSKLIFKGYDKKPISLNVNGFGFARSLKPLFYQLKDKFGTIESFTIDDKQKSKISKLKNKFVIVFNKDDYDELVNSCSEVYKENSTRLKDITQFQLSKICPKQFKASNGAKYTKNTISKILSLKGVVNELSLQDIQEIAKIIPALMDKSSVLKKSVLNKVLFVDISKKANKIKLTSIIKEYETILAKKTQKETDWQKFLRENILYFNSSYINLIEKKNISIRVSIPDFILVDQFQFVDVFEIKRPDFECLKYDKSHDNYYWSDEASKAISQVEKYLFEMETNANTIINALKEEGIDLKIIRPRGYVLIGKRSSLANSKSIKCFKILSNALKNVQVIFYDDFLESIKLKYAIAK